MEGDRNRSAERDGVGEGTLGLRVVRRLRGLGGNMTGSLVCTSWTPCAGTGIGRGAPAGLGCMSRSKILTARHIPPRVERNRSMSTAQRSPAQMRAYKQSSQSRATRIGTVDSHDVGGEHKASIVVLPRLSGKGPGIPSRTQRKVSEFLSLRCPAHSSISVMPSTR